MNIVNVIGGSGFIGKRLCRRLSENEQVDFSIIDKSDCIPFGDRVKHADVRSLEALRTVVSESSVIVNLAAAHGDDVTPLSLYDDVNIQGANNICTVAREKNINTIIFTSSVAVYGNAPDGTDESGKIEPITDYGRTKYEAEQVYKTWQSEKPELRTLVIVRPVPVIGEHNRANVYYLFRQIFSNRFIMVGNGTNKKSISYVENVAAFLEYSRTFKPGIHIYNYVDKPDFTMNTLVSTVKRMLGRPEEVGIRLPYAVAFMIGKTFDFFAFITGKWYPVSSARVKKFCTNTVYNTSLEETGFQAPMSLVEGLKYTIRHEFLESHQNENIFI